LQEGQQNERSEQAREEAQLLTWNDNLERANYDSENIDVEVSVNQDGGYDVSVFSPDEAEGGDFAMNEDASRSGFESREEAMKYAEDVVRKLDPDAKSPTDPVAKEVEQQRQEQSQENQLDSPPLRSDEPTNPQNATSQSNITQTSVEEAAREVDKLIKGFEEYGDKGELVKVRKGVSFDEAFDAVKDKYAAKTNMTPTALKTAIEAKRKEFIEAENQQLNSKTPHADFSLGNWKKFTKWFKKNIYQGLRSGGPLAKDAFAAIEKKRGFIQSQVGRIKILGKNLVI
jgi:hypothetical protein